MKNIFLADDDSDDCELFQDALRELSIQTQLTISQNGVVLMKTLDDTVPPPPYAVFLDLNMPFKDGFECLTEIRNTPKLKDIMVVIFSTTDNPVAVEKTYSLGANYYVRKRNTFEHLKKAIETILLFTKPQQSQQPPIEKFLLTIN
jgi:CheY-like chemotaxis protein